MTQQSRFRARILKRGVSLLVAGTMLSGCAEFTYRRQGPESAPIIQGPAVSNNSTLLEPVYACYRDLLNAADAKRWGLAHGYRGDKGGWIYDQDGQHTAHGWNEFWYFIGPTRIQGWIDNKNKAG